MSISIRRLRFDLRDMALTRPYTIAGITFTTASNVFVELSDADGYCGIGCASPAPNVTGETTEHCLDALQAATDWIGNVELASPFDVFAGSPAALASAPAARAAIDMAAFDLFGKRAGKPVAELLGRRCSALPTSVTIGIMPRDEAVELAREYLAQGFRALKLKIGDDVDADIETTLALRAEIGPETGLRVDANCGYDREALALYCSATATAGLELIEQPCARGAYQSLAGHEFARLFCADEDVVDERDAVQLVQRESAYAGFNIKLMKCGGIASAMRIATAAQQSGRWLMWGCMDESVVGIAAALNAAYASPVTRYIDLDGSLDLAGDIVRGGFRIDDGCLYPLDRPGLGVEYIDDR